MSLPYASATAGDSAIAELQRILGRYGCTQFGTMTDTEKGATIVQFRWRGRTVQLEASWRGYAAAWLKENPYTYRRSGTRTEWEARAFNQARVSVCSVLRDWIKGQVTAIECGVMTFDAAFLPHMLLPSGQRVVDYVDGQKLLAAPEAAT